MSFLSYLNKIFADHTPCNVNVTQFRNNCPQSQGKDFTDLSAKKKTPTKKKEISFHSPAPFQR